MTRRISLVLSLLPMLLAGAVLAAPSPSGQEDFAAANGLYREGKYDQAAAAYAKIVEGGNTSAAMYYNWGNALIKSGRLGQALWAYEKSLAENPRDPETRANLQHARSLLFDKTEEEGLAALLEKMSPAHWLSFRANAWIFCVLYWTGIALACAWLLLLRRRLPSGWRVPAIVLVGAMLAGSTLFFRSALWSHPKAIVVAKETEVRYGPMAGESAAFTLHEGSKVKVLRREGDWVQLYFAKGKVGWVPAETLGLI